MLKAKRVSFTTLTNNDVFKVTIRSNLVITILTPNKVVTTAGTQEVEEEGHNSYLERFYAEFPDRDLAARS